eukprot:Phypoly_transcript_07300.p1 GENE.Phypoly_transcript_07300~~Phypoly_transcript_07300.p1  ORF type:complete len:435 (-),score=82.94 Phypoly_transcript_07300:243-1547(-)
MADGGTTSGDETQKRPRRLGLDLNDLPPTRELIDFYRTKIEEYESEREDLISKVQLCETNHTELHRTKWELRKRMDEISDLQKALNDAQTYLFDERQHVLRLYAENDDLKIQELEDRRKIQQLLAITQPRHEEITYFKSRAPEKIHRYLPKEPTKAVTKGPSAGNGVRVLRTVYLPHEQTDTLLLTIEALRTQIEEQAKVALDRAKFLEEERVTLQEMVTSRAEADQITIQNLENKVKELHEALCATTKDYIALKHSTQSQLRAKQEEVESLRVKNRNLRKRSDQVRREAERDAQATVQAVQQHSDAFADMMRSHMQTRDDVHRETASKLEASERHYQKRVKSLDEKAASLSRRYAALASRRGLEMEGYNSEINILRRMLRDAENNLFKLKNPYHGIEMGMLAASMENAGQTMRIREDLRNIKSRIGELERVTR